MLVTQLYDPAPEVCELAAHFLKDACESKEALQLVVEMQPMMDHLGDIGHPLLMRYLCFGASKNFVLQIPAEVHVNAHGLSILV